MRRALNRDVVSTNARLRQQEKRADAAERALASMKEAVHTYRDSVLSTAEAALASFAAGDVTATKNSLEALVASARSIR